MKIAIIGAGNVGGSLAGAWIARGHEIRFGVRDTNDAQLKSLLASLGPKASAHANAEAVHGADAVVLATPWPATRAAIESCGPLSGRIVVDCTNPLLPNLAGLEHGLTTSGAEQVAAWAKGARVYKCFNQTGAENMGNQKGYAQPLAMFVAGDEPEGKRLVLGLAKDAGLDGLDAGPLSSARLLEPLAMLWIHMAYRMGLGRDFAMALVRRGAG
ncbi:MAG: hypothetical protein RL277_1908 [Planctomycetota bacterium]|jgi:predicted dinucleotide-binding enzyme